MSDKKNKDNRKEDTKSKKNMKKTQEMPVSTELKAFHTAVQTVVCLTVPNGTPLIRNFVLQRS